MPIDEKKLYEALVNDVCAKETPEYDRLCVFVYALLNKSVRKLCYNNKGLKKGIDHDDVMQEIVIHIAKQSEDYFFKPVNGETTKTCKEYKAWCRKTAVNYFRTYCLASEKARETQLNTDIKTEGVEPPAGNPDDVIDREENLREDRQEIGSCFDIVLSLKSNPHIVLTWLSVSLFMIEYDISKIQSTHLLVDTFSNFTLSDMLTVILDISSHTDWLEISEKQEAEQRLKLMKTDSDTGKMLGDMKYSDFYMKKGPEMSVSDWVNRVNEQIKKQKNDET